MSFYDGMRAVNIGISLAIFLLMLFQYKRFVDQSEQVRLLGMGLLLLLLANCYASVESYLRGIPGGPRVVFITVPLLVILIGCLWPWLTSLPRKR